VLARVIGQKIGEQMGQQVVMDNRLGAAGRIGMEYAVKSPPDGYTLVTVGNSQVIVPSVHLSVPYDLRKDVVPVAMLGTITNTLLVNPGVPAQTVAELVALAKANPGKLLFGSGGTGGITHLAGELFKSLTKIDIVHVPFKTGSLAVTAQIGNELQINVVNLLTSLPHINAGRLRALGVTGLKRSSHAPAMPTLDEQGVTGYDILEFHTLAAPAGTPAALVTRLNDEINKALMSAQVRERMSQQNAEPATMTPADTRAYLLAEQEKYARIVKAVGIKPD
jgi:tripartite-type tricarboxylate transporter receptor subunit TctC